MKRAVPVLIIALISVCMPIRGSTQQAGRPVIGTGRSPMKADGTMEMPAIALPPSSYLSARAKEALRTRHGFSLSEYQGINDNSTVEDMRRAYDAVMRPIAERILAKYAVNTRNVTIGGVTGIEVTPKLGIAPRNRHRILINLHGGGFWAGEHWGGLAEAAPIAALGRIEVITLNYRQGPEYHFPAASEDVAAVFKVLLRTYEPGAIGIYGCSAGGILSAQGTAWIIRHGLPKPGGISISCASAAGFGGDSAIVGTYMAPYTSTSGATGKLLNTYFVDVSPSDPMMAPAASPALLAKFPPTLLMVGSRDMAASSAYETDRLLTNAGVDVELHVWDGIWHGWIYDDVPEAVEAYHVMLHFFDEHLTR